MPSDKRWVGTWAAAPAPAEGVVGFNNQTIRLNPRLSIGGERLRVRISNAYGNRPLIIGAAMIALRDRGPTIVAGTGRKLSFGGRDSTVIAAGAAQYSDAVELSVRPLADLTVSFHLPSEVPANFAITGRYARKTNYIWPCPPRRPPHRRQHLDDRRLLPLARSIGAAARGPCRQTGRRHEQRARRQPHPARHPRRQRTAALRPRRAGAAGRHPRHRHARHQ